MTDTSVLTLVTSALVLATGVVGYIINRSVVNVDTTVQMLALKIDGLHAKDTLFEVALTELRVRVIQLEASMVLVQQEIWRRKDDQER